MTEYYKINGKIQFICKISDNKSYFYDNGAKHWVLTIHTAKQYLLKWYNRNQLTLLDIVMLGMDKP